MKEFVVIFLVVAVIAAIAVLFVAAIFNYGAATNPCWHEGSFSCKNSRVEECLKTEQYTRDQCVILVGGGK